MGEGYLPIVYCCLAWSQNDDFAEALIFWVTEQLSQLVVAEKVLSFYSLYNFFVANFLIVTLLLNKNRNTSFLAA